MGAYKAMTKRITLEFTDNSHKRLQALKRRTASSNYTDVVRRSLQLYEWLISHTADGHKFYFEDPKGNKESVKLFMDE